MAHGGFSRDGGNALLRVTTRTKACDAQQRVTTSQPFDLQKLTLCKDSPWSMVKNPLNLLYREPCVYHKQRNNLLS